jgi:hypothetical protein
LLWGNFIVLFCRSSLRRWFIFCATFEQWRTRQKSNSKGFVI